MDILVIGGTKFFGIPMIRDLLDKGHHITIATRGNVLDPFGNSVSRIKMDRQKPDEVKRLLGKRHYDVCPRFEARKLLRAYEKNAGYLMYFAGIQCHETWNNLMEKFVLEQKEQKWTCRKEVGGMSSVLAGKVSYFVVPIYVNNSTSKDIQNEILEKAVKKEYQKLERSLYDISDYKWKSEELMFDCVKKIFKNKSVIHQYKPMFLGLQSYDVFVCGLKIAFEYQGKQHFEPVGIFGGEEAFISIQERDARKAKLSVENGVKLIYVNYWEDVSLELIKGKLKEIGVSVK